MNRQSQQRIANAYISAKPEVVHRSGWWRQYRVPTPRSFLPAPQLAKPVENTHERIWEELQVWEAKVDKLASRFAMSRPCYAVQAGHEKDPIPTVTWAALNSEIDYCILCNDAARLKTMWIDFSSKFSKLQSQRYDASFQRRFDNLSRTLMQLLPIVNSCEDRNKSYNESMDEYGERVAPEMGALSRTPFPGAKTPILNSSGWDRPRRRADATCRKKLRSTYTKRNYPKPC